MSSRWPLEPSRVAHQSDPRNRAADQPTLYDVDTRCILRNDQEVADRSSRMDLIEDDDKGVTIDIGPVAPEGRQQKGFGDLRLVHPWLDEVLEQPNCGVSLPRTRRRVSRL